MNPVINEINPYTLIFLGVGLIVLVVFTILKLIQNIRLLRSRRIGQKDRVQNLALSRMLKHLNIPLNRYLKKTTDLEKERHMWACKSCQHPEDCKKILNGEKLNPEDICPNFPKFIHLQSPSKDS